MFSGIGGQIKGFTETQSSINSGIHSLMQAAGPAGQLASAAVGVFDTIGGALGAKTDIIDKDAAARAGFSGANNTSEILTSIPGLGTIMSAFSGKTIKSNKSAEIDALSGAYGKSTGDIDAAQKWEIRVCYLVKERLISLLENKIELMSY